jgi:hypothetical protein
MTTTNRQTLKVLQGGYSIDKLESFEDGKLISVSYTVEKGGCTVASFGSYSAAEEYAEAKVKEATSVRQSRGVRI